MRIFWIKWISEKISRFGAKRRRKSPNNCPFHFQLAVLAQILKILETLGAAFELGGDSSRAKSCFSEAIKLSENYNIGDKTKLFQLLLKNLELKSNRGNSGVPFAVVKPDDNIRTNFVNLDILMEYKLYGQASDFLKIMSAQTKTPEDCVKLDTLLRKLTFYQKTKNAEKTTDAPFIMPPPLKTMPFISITAHTQNTLWALMLNISANINFDADFVISTALKALKSIRSQFFEMTVIESKLLNILFSAYISSGPNLDRFAAFTAAAYLHEHLERSYTLPKQGRNPFFDEAVVLQRFKRLVYAYSRSNTAIYMMSFTALGDVLCVVKIGFEDGAENIDVKKCDKRSFKKNVLVVFDRIMRETVVLNKSALNVKTRNERVDWWKQRRNLDFRLKVVLEKMNQILFGIGPTTSKDEHVILILSKSLQTLPIESVPFFRNSTSAITRTFSLDLFPPTSANRTISIENVFYILNPSRDLIATEQRFRPFFEGFKSWEGVSGRAVSSDVFEKALAEKDLLIYAGHSGGEQFLPRWKVESLGTKAVTLLMGCSSGLMKPNGAFPPKGLSYSYLVSGCPAIVGNLWDVTDKDIDRFTMEFIFRWFSNREKTMVLGAALSSSRSVCKMPYLTGASPVCFGLPVKVLKHTIDVPKIEIN